MYLQHYYNGNITKTKIFPKDEKNFFHHVLLSINNTLDEVIIEIGGGFDMFDFGGFETMFTIVFILVIGVFVVTFVKGIGQWHRNNQSPRLNVEARVVSKRMDTRVHHDMVNDHMHNYTHTSTYYYVTFEVKSHDRLEFAVNGREYGMLAEGDIGELTFQGTRYIEFVRK